MRRTRKDFVSQARRTPFELELENPPEGHPGFVTFKDPNKLGTEEAIELQYGDLQDQMRILLGEDFDVFWSEWSTVPVEETNKLSQEVLDHYGAAPGKRRR